MTEDSQDTPPQGESKTFASLGLEESLCEACHQLGYKAPTEIQAESIPWSLQNRDIIALAQTGSGKTAAFALPILQAMLNEENLASVLPYAVVISPTRELAIQIADQFEKLGQGIGLRTSVIVGGVDMVAQAIALSKKPHVIVATPGRLVDHLENTKGFSLKKCKYLVLDEADRLLDLDFGPSLEKILRVLPRERRTLLFSATMTSKVEKLQRASVVNPVRIQVGQKYSTVSKLKQTYLFFPNKLKDAYAVYLVNEWRGGSIIIFMATCANAQRFSLVLRSLGFTALPLHGQMDQSQRNAALAKFRSSSAQILVATDVASRGLDIPSVDHVLNFDIPATPKDYIHRVGRTARAGRSGIAATLVTQYDVEAFQKIEAALGFKLEEYDRGVDREAVSLLQERVAEAQRVVIMELKEKEKVKKLKNNKQK
jgi:ATP-dependent RNA helicase DDX47/RRP3